MEIAWRLDTEASLAGIARKDWEVEAADRLGGARNCEAVAERLAEQVRQVGRREKA
jgi:hypothetical protein